MSTQIFINLPVADLERSREFFGSLGYLFNPQFTDDNAACLIIDEEHIYVMLIEREYFASYTSQEIADANKTVEMVVSLSVDTKEEVDTNVDRAILAGAGRAGDAQDHGYMYGRSFLDLDGHHWEIFCMQEGARSEWEGVG